MTLEKQFNLDAAEKPKTTQPSQQRRQKFIAAIDKQLAGMQAGNASKTWKSTWVWQTSKGDWFISPRYGRTPLELAPGLTAIKCSDAEDVVQNLEKLKNLTSDGKLDAVLETAASEIRSRFGK
ncbi:hypothetical protein AVO45_13365 [Ruegeria marisrubri]|uniref:Uncharacterized protein n=1 Tax=Ruegeria marisrubri TaxID=1685379 RepID=A0A0X3TKV3_9RHOB|nr:hypothetical protein [Ruegeria marisrubri]KUJ76289.1 hypothetical protein AVO45_13365 [Ruegeria marisrubri]